MIAIIPARGGSKGLPNKNIRDLCGKPLIAYTINTALEAKSISRVIVSTDNFEIAEIALEYNAEVPFMRPMELATDKSLVIDTYIYTIDKLNENAKYTIKDFVVLQPTTPLRNSEDIENAIRLFKKKKADSVISYYEAIHPPVWAKRINNQKLENYFNIDSELKNRQEIEPAYFPNGAIYIFNYRFLKSTKSYFSEKTYPYIMPRERSVDIDTIEDFEYVEFLLRKHNKNE